MKSIKYIELTKLFKSQRVDQLKLLLLSAFSISLNLFFLYNIQAFIDIIIEKRNQHEVLMKFCYICVIGIGNFGIGIYQNRKWHLFRYKLINQMRIMMYDKLLGKRASFFDKRTTGDIVSAIMNDGSLIAENVGISVLMLVLNLFQVFVITIILIFKNVILGCAVMIIGGFYFLFVNRINKRMRIYYKDYSQENANLNQRLTEDVRTILEIKTLNEKEFFINKFYSQVWNKFFLKAKRVVNIEVLSNAANSLVSIIIPVFMILLGGFFLYQGTLTVGVLILFYTYTQNLIEPLNNLADFYRGTQIAVGTAERIYEYLFSTDEETEIESNLRESEVDLLIDINHFAWEKKDVLQNIHVNYTTRDRVFIKGKSGSGKTTLLKLICGFYEISDGNIKICNVDVHKIKEEELFEILKIQFQEPIVIEGSIRENISLGKCYNDNEILEILDMVQMKSFVTENSLDYQILEAGKNLSGGQKQRLALARLLIRKPKILILDEATNGLDIKNEQIIVRNIEKYVEENNGILLVTSHKNEMREICNKVLEIKKE